MPKRLPRSRTLKGDPKLVYYDSGGGAPGEPPILLIHGATLRSEDWENIFPRLGTRYRVVAYDQRGHGKSARAPRYALADLVDDAEHVLRDLVAAPAIVIGHSIGGAVALAAAARAPELVRGLVLEDPWLSLYGPAWRAEFFAALAAALELQGDPPAFARAVSKLPLPNAGARGERTVGEVRGFYAPERMVTYYSKVDPAFVAALRSGDEEGRSMIDAAPAKVRCPVLLLVADPRQGTALDEGEPERLKEQIADLTIVRFPGVAHRIHGVRPEPFLEALEPFLRRIRTTPAA